MLTSLQSNGKVKGRLKWIDNAIEENKKMLVTNKSNEDLLHKEEADVAKVDTHRRVFSGKPVLKNKHEV